MLSQTGYSHGKINGCRFFMYFKGACSNLFVQSLWFLMRHNGSLNLTDLEMNDFIYMFNQMNPIPVLEIKMLALHF